MSRGSSEERPPSREVVELKLAELIGGHCTREEAAAWAGPWFLEDEVRVEDPIVLRALERLVGADLPTVDRPYLHGIEDFETWLEELKAPL